MTISFVSLVEGFLLLVALAMAVMAAVAFTRRRRAPESLLIMLITAAAGCYCFGYALEVAQTSLNGAIFWLRVEYIGIPWIPALWVILTRRHFGLPHRAALLSIIPVIVSLAEWTNDLHHLYDWSMALVPSGPFYVVQVERGPIAWLNLAYLYGSLFYTTILCIAKFRKSSGLRRWQIAFFGSSCLPPLAGYTLYLLDLSPWDLDLAPVTLCLTVIIGYVTVFRLECFNLVPMARSLVFNSMRDAVLVTDLRNRLVDFNPAACSLFPSICSKKLGRDVSFVFPAGEQLTASDWKADNVRQMRLGLGGLQQQYEIRFFALGTEHQQLGWAIIFANITAQVELVKELQKNAETDSLTGAANRRAFDLAMDRECARTARYGSPFALMLLDIDHFKQINDQCGHTFGDRVLLQITVNISACLRSSDLLARYGGDEFAILLPETDLTRAEEVAERIRTEIERAEVQDAGIRRATISIGLSAFVPGTGADPHFLFKQADEALYAAKQKGRNRVATWPGLSVLPNPLARQAELR